MQQKWALITGASAGIGASFATQLAAKGWSLVLVARRADKLNSLQQYIAGKYPVSCKTLSLDLSQLQAAQQVFQYCQQHDIQISMLINNAGYGVPGDFDAVSWQTHNDMLQVMLMATSLMWPHWQGWHRQRLVIPFMQPLSHS